MKSRWVLRPGAAEFPHENALIERGVLWTGNALCGAELPISSGEPLKPHTFGRIRALAPPMRAETILPPPPLAEPVGACAPPIAAPTVPVAAHAEPIAAPTVPVAMANEPLRMRAETMLPPPPSAPVPAAGAAVGAPSETAVARTDRIAAEPDRIAAHDERVETFLRAVTEVALAHGPAETAAHVASLFKFGTPAPIDLSPSARAALLDGNILEATDGDVHTTAWFARTRTAWQSMLRGDGGNLAECGESTLDGWTADLIARLVAKPNMASTIRRDLRRRGIAAFGMLDS